MATMTADEYRKIVKAIINTATGGSAGGSHPWNALNKGNYSAQDFYDLMQTRSVKNAGYDVVLNADGSVRTYTYINKNGQIANLGSYDDIAGAFNSNHQTGTASGGTVQFTQPIDTSLTVPTETEPAAVKSAGTMTKYTGGVKGVGNFVFGSVLPAIGAAATGVALGKNIDSLLYNANPDFWNEHGMESINPDTWKTITADNDSLGAKAFNTIFGINPDTGNTQMYLDENAFSYMALYLQNKGIFAEGTEECTTTENAGISNIPLPLYRFKIKATNVSIKYNEQSNPTNHTWGLINGLYYKGYQLYCSEYNSNDINGYACITNNDLIIGSKDTFYRNLAYIDNNNIYHIIYSTSDSGHYYKYNNLSVYHSHTTELKDNLTGKISGGDTNNYDAATTGWSLLYGNFNIISNVEGIDTQPDTIMPDLSDLNDIGSVLQKLKETYPELWNSRVENNVVQPDGSTKTYTYIPVPLPTGGTADQPTTEGAKQSQPEVDPSTATDTLLKTLVQILTQTKPVGMTDTPIDPINPNPPDIGGGDTPVVVVPTGSASALYTVYNPTQQQLSSFGAWLWSTDFVDQIKKLFNDPMQSIIGLHKIFCTPTISGSSNIKVGYLDSGIASNVVSDQYTTLSCGSVDLAEYFGNIFDYSPYTDISLYLPFVGIVRLNTADVMRSKLTVTYHFDVLTGACLAEVKVTRDSYDTVLYQYTGNASTQYPLSSGSYMGILSGILSIAGGIAGTVATGGTAAPLLIGSAASALSMKTKVERSGSLSGNAGAMGIKIPYLIISRPQSALANNYQNYVGIPANQETLISDTTGFVKYDVIHLTGVSATEKEKSEIQTLFSQGVLI